MMQKWILTLSFYFSVLTFFLLLLFFILSMACLHLFFLSKTNTAAIKTQSMLGILT